MLKKSMYNVEIDKSDNKGVLLFNSKTLALGILNKDTQEIYKYDKIDKSDIENDEIKKNIELMIQNGFLVDENIDEYKLVELMGRMVRYSGERFTLTITPSLDCNMACPYCYEKKKAKKLDENKINLLISFVKKNIEQTNPKYFSVNWYGGEPLLEKGIIKRLSKEFIEIARLNNIKYSSYIITNGTLLDYDTAKMLKDDCNITNAQITIDGLKETHNSRRLLINGEDSFDIISNNIDKCKEIIKIAIRVNLDKTNVNEAEKLIEYFVNEKKWGNYLQFYFAPVLYRPTEACSANIHECFTMSEFGEIDSELLKRIYEKNGNSFVKDIYPRSLFVPCGAVTVNSFVVDAEGYFYTCWDLVGISEHSIGNLWEQGPVLNKEYIEWLSIETPNECTKCKLLCLCQGGCPHIRLRNGNQPQCNHKVISYVESLKIKYKEHVSLK